MPGPTCRLTKRARRSLRDCSLETSKSTKTAWTPKSAALRRWCNRSLARALKSERQNNHLDLRLRRGLQVAPHGPLQKGKSCLPVKRTEFSANSFSDTLSNISEQNIKEIKM